MELCEVNFQRFIENNPYPGRCIVMGVSKDKHILQLYSIMGRSSNSRNRVFEAEEATLRTRAADESKMQDPSLVIYDAMLEVDRHFIVSNGDQTTTIYQNLIKGEGTFESALTSRDREPDGPNYTPRITGMMTLNGGVPFFRYAIVKANRFDSRRSDRHFFYKEVIAPERGYFLSTYEGDGAPLPSFSGEPMEFPMVGSPEEILETYWNALDKDNRISLAIKDIDPSSGKSTILIKNRYSADGGT